MDTRYYLEKKYQDIAWLLSESRLCYRRTYSVGGARFEASILYLTFLSLWMKVIYWHLIQCHSCHLFSQIIARSWRQKSRLAIKWGIVGLLVRVLRCWISPTHSMELALTIYCSSHFQIMSNIQAQVAGCACSTYLLKVLVFKFKTDDRLLTLWASSFWNRILSLLIALYFEMDKVKQVVFAHPFLAFII